MSAARRKQKLERRLREVLHSGAFDITFRTELEGVDPTMVTEVSVSRQAWETMSRLLHRRRLFANRFTFLRDGVPS